MSFELDESQWLDLQPYVSSECEDTHQQSHDSSVFNDGNSTVSKCLHNATQSASSSHSLVSHAGTASHDVNHNSRCLCDSPSVSTHDSNVSLLSEHSLPLPASSQPKICCTCNYSLYPSVESSSDSSSGKDYSSTKSLSQHSLLVSNQSASRTHNHCLKADVQTTHPSCGKSEQNLPIANRSSNSCIHRLNNGSCVKSTPDCSSKKDNSSCKSFSQHSIRVSDQTSSNVQTLSTSNVSNRNHYSLSTQSQTSTHSFDGLQNTVVSLVQTNSRNYSGVHCLSHHSFPKVSTSESRQNNLSQHSLSVVSTGQANSTSESRQNNISQHSLRVVSSGQANSTSESRQNNLSQHSLSVVSSGQANSTSELRQNSLSQHSLCGVSSGQANSTSESKQNSLSQHSLRVVSSGQANSTSESKQRQNSLSQHSLCVVSSGQANSTSESKQRQNNLSQHSLRVVSSGQANSTSESKQRQNNLSQHSVRVVSSGQANSTSESRQNNLSQHSVLVVSTVQANSRKDLRTDRLNQHNHPIPKLSKNNSALQSVARREYSSRMDSISGQPSTMGDTTSLELETLFADSSQDSTIKLSTGHHGYSTDDTSEGLGLSEYPIELPSRSPNSDQAATEDNSECEEVVQSAISEVYKDFLSGKFSPSNVPESDSSQVSSDNEVKLAERSVHGKYPETAAGMSDNDWNPYVTESDSNISPRLENTQSGIRPTSESVISQFSPPLSSTANGTSSIKTTSTSTLFTPLSNTNSGTSNSVTGSPPLSSTANGTSSIKTTSTSTLFTPLSNTNSGTSNSVAGSDQLIGRHHEYPTYQSSFPQSLTRSEENLRSFLGRDVEKRHLESLGATPLVADSYTRSSSVKQAGERFSKDHAAGAQHGATYLKKSHPTDDIKEMSAGLSSSYKRSLDDGKNDIFREKSYSQISNEKLSIHSSSETSHSSETRPLYSESDLKFSYSSTLPGNVIKSADSLPLNKDLADRADKVLPDSDDILDRRVRVKGTSYPYRKDKKPNHQFAKEADTIEQEVLSTEPASSDFLPGNALSQSSKSTGSTYSSASKEVQHLIGNGDYLEHSLTRKEIQQPVGSEDHLEHSSSSKELQQLLGKSDRLEIKSGPSLSDRDGDGILKTRVNDILTKTSYLEQDRQMTSAQTERMLFEATRLPSNIDYSQLHHDLQEIQKSLHNFSDRDDSDAGSENSVKLNSKESSFTSAGSSKDGTIIPSTTTTPDRLPVRRQYFTSGQVGVADGQLSVRTSQEDETDQSDDLRKNVQDSIKVSHYNSEGEETHGSSSSAKGESDSGQRTPTFSSQHRTGEVRDVDEFLQNVRLQRSLIQSRAEDHSNSFSNVSGMASQITQILQQDNPRIHAHGILKEVDTQERELTEQLANRRTMDFSFTDNSGNCSQSSFIITDEDVRKRLQLSGLSSLETSSCGEGYSDLSAHERSKSPFSAFKEARRFMSKQMEMVQERSFDHSFEIRTPYRPVLSTYPVYGFKKDSEKENGSNRRRVYEHTGVREAWQHHHSERPDRSQISETDSRRHPEDRSGDSSSLPSRIPKPIVESHSVTERRAATSTQRQLPVIVGHTSEPDRLPVSADQVNMNYSISERRFASSPAGEVQLAEELTSTESSQVSLVQDENKTEPAIEISDQISSGVPSPADSDSSAGRRRERYRPYRPAGSREMYYTESDTTDSITTMESTHTGSDDAVPPYFPSHVLGSRKDPTSVIAGIYGTKLISHSNQLAPGISLSTIEERSVVDDKDRPQTSSSRSSTEIPPVLEHQRRYEADVRRSPVKIADLSDSRGQERIVEPPPASQRDYQFRLVAKLKGDDEETYRRQDPEIAFDTRTLSDENMHKQGRNEMISGTGSLELPYSSESSDQMRQIIREPVTFDGTNEKLYHARVVRVRDCATSPIIAHQAQPQRQKKLELQAQPQKLKCPEPFVSSDERIIGRSSAYEERNGGSGDVDNRYVDIRDVKLVSDLTEDPKEERFTQQMLERGDSLESKRTDVGHDFTAYKACIARRMSGSPPQTSVERNGGSGDVDSRYVDIRDVKLVSDLTEDPKEERFTQQMLERGDSLESKRTDVGHDFTAYKACIARRMSGSPPQTSVVFSSQYSSPHVHSTVQTSTGLSAVRQESSLNDLTEQPSRQTGSQNDQPKQESTPSRRPRSGRSEMRDRIVQERNNRIPDNSTSEEEIEQKIDKTPISRKVQLLRQTLEQEIDLTIAPNINTVWQRFQELNSTETDSTMNTSRMETFSHIVPSPTKHTVQLLFSQREQGRQQKEKKVAEERETRRKEGITRERSTRENKNNANFLSNSKPDSDTLYSIPEDSFGTPLKLKSPNKKHYNVIDPHMGKLHDKIQRQKDKIDKERKKELRRMEKLVKLEQLLKAKRRGQISSPNLSQSIDDISSTSVPTESSPDFTSYESTLTTSSMSDTPTEETTAKDSSVEMLLAKMAKDQDRTMDDSAEISDLYHEAVRKHFHSKDKEREQIREQETVRKHFHSKDKERRSKEEQIREQEKRLLNQMLKDKAKQKHKQTKRHGSSVKENVDSYQFLLHRRQAGVCRQDKRKTSPGKGKKSESFSSQKSSPARNLSTQWELEQRERRMVDSTPNNKEFSIRHKLRRKQSDVVAQTSPFVNSSKSWTRSPSPKRDCVPVVSIPVKTKRSRSTSPPYSMRYTPETTTTPTTPTRVSVKNRKNKPASKGIAWFVELKNNRPSRESVSQDRVWKQPLMEDRPWREPLKERQEQVREVVHIRPLVEKHEEELLKNNGVKEMIPDPQATDSLQDVFSEHMALFISRSRERQKRLQLAAQERHMQDRFRLEHERLFGDRRKHAQVYLETDPISEKHYKPRRRLLSKQEQKDLTEKIYSQLPEVVNRQRQRREILQKELNRLRARVFNKKVQRVVLTKAGVFG